MLQSKWPFNRAFCAAVRARGLLQNPLMQLQKYIACAHRFKYRDDRRAYERIFRSINAVFRPPL